MTKRALIMDKLMRLRLPVILIIFVLFNLTELDIIIIEYIRKFIVQ